MALFDWNDKYSVKISEIDNQHKQLVSMVNTMHEAMLNRQGREVLGSILTQLVSYTKNHFATEEKLMEQHGFPGYQEHKDKHDKMAQKVLSLQADFQQGNTQLTISVSNFLKDWLNKHILGTDMKYSTFLNEKGVN